jgi:RNA polymerase sigma factor (sigma-70 family)
MMCPVEVELPTAQHSSRPPAMPARLLSDERLAKEVASGRESAFTALFSRYHQQLYRYCRSLTGSDQDAQDALQSTFANALIALRAARRDAPLRPWLYRIAHNESISLVRSRRPTLEVPEELASTVDVHDSAQQRERLATLVADLQELPERQRGALVMRELNGLSHEEIAQALQVSVGAAKQTIFEARRSLLEFAEGRAMGCEDVLRVLSDADGRSLRGRRIRGHLRTCPSCSAFASGIQDRRADMLALWPVLPAASAAGLLAKLTGAGSAHGGGGKRRQGGGRDDLDQGGGRGRSRCRHRGRRRGDGPASLDAEPGNAGCAEQFACRRSGERPDGRNPSRLRRRRRRPSRRLCSPGDRRRQQRSR